MKKERFESLLKRLQWSCRCDSLWQTASHMTYDTQHIIGHFRDDFTGHMTQPTTEGFSTKTLLVGSSDPKDNG